MSATADKLRVGVIGVGWQGEGHLANFTACERAELTAICDVNAELLAQRAEAFGVPNTFADYHDLLACDAVDAVAIVTPDHLHREIAVAAFQAGKHVLLEKPMATNMADAQAIADAAHAAKGIGMLNLSNRWMYTFAKGKDLVDSGAVGDIQYVFARMTNRIDVPTEKLTWLKSSHPAHWIGVHRLDIARWWLGREAVRVRGVHRKGVLASQGYDAPDFYQATIEFDGGAVMSLEGGWSLPLSHPSIIDSKFYALCTKGVVDIDRVRSELLVTTADAYQPSTPTAGAALDQRGGFTFRATRHFVDCALGGTQPMTTIDDGLALTRILCAVVESCEADGKVVEL